MLQLDVDKLRRAVQKPIRVEFVTPGRPHLYVSPTSGFYMVICCSASRPEEGDDDHYVQGAGDDTENWACGLTSRAFWPNQQYLCGIGSDDDVQARVKAIMLQERLLEISTVAPIYPPAGSIPFYIGTLENAKNDASGAFDCIVTCDEYEQSEEHEEAQEHEEKQKSRSQSSTLRLACRTSKLGSRTLRDQLGRLDPFIKRVCLKTATPTILFACSTGKDLSVGVALTVLCTHYDDEGTWLILSPLRLAS